MWRRQKAPYVATTQHRAWDPYTHNEQVASCKKILNLTLVINMLGVEGAPWSFLANK